MATLVTMPKLGLTMTEGVVSKWHKKEGDTIEKSETLFEVSTDKITNEVEAGDSGVVRKILVGEGETAQVTQAIAIIAGADEDISGLLDGDENVEAEDKAENKAENKVEDKAFDKPAAGPVETKGFIKASPAAKKCARDNGIDIGLVTGTGPSGRIVEKDVMAFIKNNSRKVKASPVAVKMADDMGVNIEAIDKNARIMKEDVLAAAQLSVVPAEDRRIAATGMRKVIAQRMTESWHIAPMVTLNIETDATQLKAFRAQLKDKCQAKGIKLSYNDILIKICAKALKEYSIVNATYEEEEIVLHGNVNIGLAVALEGGLIVPNVKAVQAKSIMEIAAETDEIVDKAKNNKLTKDEMTGGTFTITNLGMFGIDTFTPIINQPESAILGVNAMVDRPVVVDGQVVVRPIMNLSLTIDHRIIDGADGAKFLARIKELIENPLLLLL